MKTNPTTTTFKGYESTIYVVTVEPTDKRCEWPDCANLATHTFTTLREDEVIVVKHRCDADAFSLIATLENIESYHDGRRQRERRARYNRRIGRL